MGNQSSRTESSTSPKSLRLTNLTAVRKSSFDSKADVILIWLDQSIDPNRTTLREVTNDVLLYTEIPSCLEYIRSHRQERIFFILSGLYAQECLDEMHQLVQIDSIFIFCMNVNKYREKFLQEKSYPKVVNIFDDEQQLIQSVRSEIDCLHKQLATFSLYEKQKTTRDLSKESASFLWFQLLKDVLLRMPRSEEAKQELIDQCRHYFRGNTEELQNIDEFARTYTENDSIRWYTKQSFLYRLCNKALRTEDIELLYIFRYFIQDLSKRLALESTSSLNYQLYRGLKLTQDELTRFQSHIGSLISTNGFLSTTRNYQLALEFALKTSKRSVDVFPTVFLIDIDPNIPDVIYADISSLSVYPEEEEVLFDLGCAFKITEVSYNDEEKIWIIRMISTNEGREIVETYIEENRREMEKGNVLLIFGLLLTEMGHYHQAQIYFENLLSSKSVDDFASLYTNLGRVKFLKGLFDEALKDFQRVYQIQHEQPTINQLDLARTMNNIALIYIEQKSFPIALTYLFQVREICENKNFEQCSLLLANVNNSIGVILTRQKKYQQALDYLFDAMKLYEENLPTNDHPNMATNVDSIGLVYYHQKNYQQAFDFFSKALAIREKILPADHLHLADSYNNLALVHHQFCNYDQALTFFQRSLSIYEDHPDQNKRRPICWNNIGLLYLDQKNFDQAIEYFLRASNFYSKENSSNQNREEMTLTLSHLAEAHQMKEEYQTALNFYQQALTFAADRSESSTRILAKIAWIYQKQNDTKVALEYYQKALDQCDEHSSDLLCSILMPMAIIHHQKKHFQEALEFYKRILSIRKHHLPDDQTNLAWTYNNLGCLYTDLGDIEHALKYQQKALHIRQKILPSNHPDLATSLNNLGRIYQTHGHLHDFEQALNNYQGALHIRRESLSSDHPDLASTYYNLALIHFDQQNYPRANEEIHRALKIQRKILPLQHPDLQNSLALEQRIQFMLIE